MPNSFVFPGGTLDQLDSQFPEERTNFDRQQNEGPIRLGLESDFPLRVCAIREMFEESGLLPVADGNCRERALLSVREDTHLAEWRRKILKEPEQFPQLFSSSQKMDVNSLVPWANWLTPVKDSPKRYDAAFFLLPTADSPKSTHCIKEMVEAYWTEPSKIIERSAKSEVSLPPPQFYELLRIRLLNLKQPEGFHRQTNAMRITPHLCRVQEQQNVVVNLMPGDHLYDVGNPNHTPPKARPAKELLPPYPDDEQRPIHRIIFHSDPPRLLYHRHELHMKNLPEDFRFHLFHQNKPL